MYISTADVDETWSIDEASKKFQATPQRRSADWSVAFKGGVDLDDTVIQDTFGLPTQQEFNTRYDLTFLSPISQSVRCKVR